MAARVEAISPLAFYGAPKSHLNAVLSCKNYFPPHFSVLGSLPVPIAGPSEQGEQAHPGAPHAAPQSKGLPPGRWAAEARPSAPGRDTHTHGSCRPSHPLGSPGVPRGSSGSGSRRPRRRRGGPAGRSNSSPAHRGRGRTCSSPVARLSPGWGGGKPAPRRGSGTARVAGSAGLAGWRARVGEGLWEIQKKDLKVRRSEKRNRLSLPRQPALTRRLHLGGKLQTSVEDSNTPGANNEERNNNDNNDNAFPCIKTWEINVLLHPLPPRSPNLWDALSFRSVSGAGPGLGEG